ncbi:MAG: RNase adapter RapZ [Acidimicrobiia bacterium]|nr:RNase adapter RapZ [Acidimicrobiia bacterium]MDH3471460.1 RNase adapter RapZ [Acidimicrobiia bacterium]
MADQPRLVIITGMSGAGRSHAAEFLEDAGYGVVDNLPPSLIRDVVTHVDLDQRQAARLAVVVDTRRGLTFDELDDALLEVDAMGVAITVLFLDADDATLLKRYSEARRPHPVQAETLADSVTAEREALANLRESADIVIDTSDRSIPQLTEQLRQAFGDSLPERPLRISLSSFGFKYGVPRAVDLLFDVRFLVNPHWDPQLRPLTGLDPAVASYVLKNEDAKVFLEQLMAMLSFLVPKYIAEGKKYLSIGIGCTGGRHRSVAIAEEIARRLADVDLAASVSHRDIDQ